MSTINTPPLEMNIRLLSLVFLPLLVPSSLTAGDVLSDERVRQLKSATVKVHSDFPMLGSSDRMRDGSGFLAGIRGDAGYVVTSLLLVQWGPPKRELADEVVVTFDYGLDTERKLDAVVAGIDFAHGIAILKVPATNLPEPLRLNPKRVPKEGKNYLVALSAAVEESFGKTENAIGVKEVRYVVKRSSDGQIVSNSMPGKVEFINAGGPVVNNQGEVVAMARCSTHVAGFVLNAEILQSLFGCVTTIGFQDQEVTDGVATIKMKGSTIDLFGHLKRAGVLVVRSDNLVRKPARDNRGIWPRIATDAHVFQLKLEGNSCTGTAELELTQAKTTTFNYQAVWQYHDGRVEYGRPGIFLVRVRPTSDSANRPLPDFTDLTPTLESISIQNSRSERDDATVTELLFTEQKKPAIPITWSPDGKYLYLYTNHGIAKMLRKIRVQFFQQVAALGFGQIKGKTSEHIPTYVGTSSQGLVAGFPNAQGISVIDPETMQVTDTIKADLNSSLFTSTAASSLVFSVSTDFKRMVVLDLDARKVTQSYDLANLLPRPDGVSSLHKLVFAPNGKYLIGITNKSIYHIEIANKKLKLRSHSVMPSTIVTDSVSISPDSKHLGLFAGRITQVFEYPEFEKPLKVLPTEFGQRIQFDSRRKKIYVGERKRVVVLGFDGQIAHRYELPGGLVTHILPNPNGDSLAVTIYNSMNTLHLRFK